MTEGISSFKTRIILAPPGAGKTWFKERHPGVFVDPEESIDWKRAAKTYGLYHPEARRLWPEAILEQELNWPAVWTEEIIPRLRVAMLLEKSVLMGMITPSCSELAARFLSAFKKQAALFLPDKERHLGRHWGDPQKRARLWGPQLRGWQNTFWIRLLLRGLADDLCLPVVEKLSVPTKVPDRRPGASAREAIDIQGRHFIEVFFGRWALLDARDEVAAMYVERRQGKDGLHLRCDRTGKKCGTGEHECQKEIVLARDLTGHALNSWIACDKLTPITRGKKKTAVLFFAGTLAPFHRGHLEAMDAAKESLEAKGWRVIGGYATPFVNLRAGRAGALDQILRPIRHRAAMAQLGAMHSAWVMADVPTEHVLRSALLKRGTHPAQSLVKRLRAQGALSSNAPVTTFWVNGTDAYLDEPFYKAFAAYAEADPLNPLRLLIVNNRPGVDHWSKQNMARRVPSLSPFVLRHKVRSSRATSATAARQALLAGDRSALQESVGLPLVEAYLMGLMNELQP